MPILIRFLTAALYAAAGLSILVFLTNRWLISIHDSPFKHYQMVVTGLLLTLAPFLMGFVLGPSSLVWVPAFILLIALAGEVRRVLLRRHYRGGPPTRQLNNHATWRKPDTTTDLVITHYEVECPQWDGNELTIAHISDFHVNNRLPLCYFQEAVDCASQSQPDLIFITGDFVSESKYAPLLPDILKHAHSRYGTFAIFGNHDYWAGAEQVAAEVKSAGIDLLYNQSRIISLDNGACLVVSGNEDPWNNERWSPPTVASGDLFLVLSHTADNIYTISQTGADAVFSGHYHAGQVRVPLLGSLIVPSDYGRQFDHGHFIVNKTHLFVTAGIGSIMPPFRLYCPPDIFVIKFKGRASRKL